MAAKDVGYIAPPVSLGAVSIGGVGGGPVELRRDVVDRAVLEPSQRVAVNLVVLPVVVTRVGTDAIAGVLVARCRHAAGDARGRDSESHVGVGSLDGVVDLFDHIVHIAAAPVGYRHAATAVLVALVGVPVGGSVVLGHVVGIEVVIKDDAVDVVILYHLATYIDNSLACSLQRRIEDGVAVVVDEHVVGNEFLVERCAPSGVAAACPSVGVDPRMAFHASLVAFLNHEGQWIPREA